MQNRTTYYSGGQKALDVDRPSFLFLRKLDDDTLTSAQGRHLTPPLTWRLELGHWGRHCKWTTGHLILACCQSSLGALSTSLTTGQLGPFSQLQSPVSSTATLHPHLLCFFPGTPRPGSLVLPQQPFKCLPSLVSPGPKF